MLLTLIIAHNHEINMIVSPIFHIHSLNKHYLNACPKPATSLGTKKHTLISTYVPYVIYPIYLCMFKSSLSLKIKILEAVSDSIELSLPLQGPSTTFVNGHLPAFSYLPSGLGSHSSIRQALPLINGSVSGKLVLYFVLCSGASVKGG